MSVTREGAVEYLSKRLNGEVFTAESVVKQDQALQSASDILNPYLSGVASQEADAAVYEQALWLLGPRAQLQADGVTSMTISGISESYDSKKEGRPASVAPSAWQIIRNTKSSKGSGAVWLY